MARIILVHGAWHGGWCWERIVPTLVARGHEVSAPDLPGMGEDAGLGHAATLDEWAMFIAGMARGGAPVLLVGHSRGGIVISRAAEIAPDAITGLVYLAAVMALPGQCMGDLFRTPSANALASVRMSEDGRTTCWADAATARAAFYNQCLAGDAEAAFARLSPEPATMAGARLALTPQRYGRVPRTYIRCERDGSVSPELQAEMVAAQPCPTLSLDTDHSPFYSMPGQLAEMLDGLTRDG